MFSGSRLIVAMLLAGAGSIAIANTMPAAAASKKAEQVRAASTVTAVSVKTRQTITAPVRRGQWGDEVRLPGGTWIDCKSDCRETLRQETVDFWERQEQRDRQNN